MKTNMMLIMLIMVTGISWLTDVQDRSIVEVQLTEE